MVPPPWRVTSLTCSPGGNVDRSVSDLPDAHGPASSDWNSPARPDSASGAPPPLTPIARLEAARRALTWPRGLLPLLGAEKSVKSRQSNRSARPTHWPRRKGSGEHRRKLMSLVFLPELRLVQAARYLVESHVGGSAALPRAPRPTRASSASGVVLKIHRPRQGDPPPQREGRGMPSGRRPRASVTLLRRQPGHWSAGWRSSSTIRPATTSLPTASRLLTDPAPEGR